MCHQRFDWQRLIIISIVWITLQVTSVSYSQDNNDNNLGVTIQLPTLGVSIDAQGILATQVFKDPNGLLQKKRIDSARNSLPQQLLQPSTMRKISMRRLELALQARIDTGGKPTDSMSSLAGLTGIDYVFVMPDDRDIVIAGPAEPWVQTPAGRTIGIHSGKPTMLLEDWVTALRTFASDKNPNAWVACSIDPSPQGLANLKTFQKNLPHQISPGDEEEAATVLSERMRESLGLADVKVYGIHPRSHAAHVMIEADYRMKLIAVGLEAPPIRMKTYIEMLTGAPKYLQRWWLTPNYKCLRQSNDGLAVQMIEGGVQLQTENLTFGPKGKINRNSKAAKLKPSRAARTYASSFTQNYEQLAAARPVFAQLRNVIDGFIMAAWVRANNGYELANWYPGLLLDEAMFPVSRRAEIQHAKCVANAVWKQNVLILPAGGGVSISAIEAMQESNMVVEPVDGPLHKANTAILLPASEAWWWD